MKILFRVLAIFFALGIIGNWLDNEFSLILIVADIVCFYFGWGHGFDKIKKENTSMDKAELDLMREAAVLLAKPTSQKFSEAQKHALICSLYVVAIADSEIHQKEQEYINKIANDIKYNYDEQHILANVLNDRVLILEVLKGLSRTQKVFLMTCLDGVLKADGLELEMEFVYLESILVAIGIDFNNYLKVNNRPNPFNDEAYKRNWKTTFNETQKKAILAILYGMATDENLEFSDVTSRNFAINQHMLGCKYEIDDLMSFVNDNDKEVTQIIFGMGEQQKKVFLILACAMGRARNLNMDQILEADILINQCGINSEDFMNEYYQNAK